MVRDLSNNNELILEAKNVTKQFKVSKKNILTACDNINLSMYKGKTLGIVGESGCGKFTNIFSFIENFTTCNFL